MGLLMAGGKRMRLLFIAALTVSLLNTLALAGQALAPMSSGSGGSAAGSPRKSAEEKTGRVISVGSGISLVIVEGDTLIARDQTAERDVQKMFEDYRLTKATLEDTKKLLQDTEALVQRYRDEIKLKDTIIAKTDSLARDYKRLYEKAKHLSREPSLRFEGGLGLSDGKAAVLAGVGFRRVNFWTTIREDLTSYFIGVNLPVRIPWID